MLNPTKFVISATVALSFAAPVFAQDITAETVLANVNGTEITLGHVIAASATLPAEYQQAPDEALLEGLLENLIQQSILASAVTEVPKAVALASENAERSLLAGTALDNAFNASITDEALQEAYDARIAGFEAAKEFNASHILVETEEEATAVKQMLTEGADFAETAREKSTGPSGPNGGELGWFGTGMMVPEFETAVMEMDVGEVSVPVQTQFGWHLIILNDARDTEAPTLEALRAELASGLEQATAEKLIEDLTAKASVERTDLEGFDPANIRNVDLLAN
ncbi:MAG: peptidylprolyl isomerase [Pseudoruegeria sp.]